jgi:hypothetical protein
MVEDLELISFREVSALRKRVVDAAVTAVDRRLAPLAAIQCISERCKSWRQRWFTFA